MSSFNPSHKKHSSIPDIIKKKPIVESISLFKTVRNYITTNVRPYAQRAETICSFFMSFFLISVAFMFTSHSNQTTVLLIHPLANCFAKYATTFHSAIEHQQVRCVCFSHSLPVGFPCQTYCILCGSKRFDCMGTAIHNLRSQTNYGNCRHPMKYRKPSGNSYFLPTAYSR